MENNNIYETEEQNGTFYESENSEENSTEIRKCASCGANMVYDPEARALKCPYCGLCCVVRLPYPQGSTQQRQHLPVHRYLHHDYRWQ